MVSMTRLIHLSSSQIEEALRLYNIGYPIAKIITEMHLTCTNAGLRDKLKRETLIQMRGPHAPVHVIAPYILRYLYINCKIGTKRMARLLCTDEKNVRVALREYNIPVRNQTWFVSQTAENHFRWKGGKINRGGYAFSTKGNMGTRMKGRYKADHVEVMENYIGRPLVKGEYIHHIDGQKTNNNINNLYLTNSVEHSTLHGQLGRLAQEMYRRGYISFKNGQYHINEEKLC